MQKYTQQCPLLKKKPCFNELHIYQHINQQIMDGRLFKRSTRMF